MNIQVSPKFRIITLQAVFAIILFVFVYLLLLLLAIGLTALCVYGGIALIKLKPMAITIGIGIGLSSLGFFILIFLFKFLFKQHKVDRSHLIEISMEEEPKLFSFIREIAIETQTDFPKRIYLSSNVNAAVFYDSNFWSMFLPIRKNLQIGLGLVNTISEQEFKAILAHEFGHFSQRSMKVGSYVYNVNQVIYNMLYDNESFEEMIASWANFSGYFSIFVSIAISIIQGIQGILRKMYDFVNVSYLALSREMEFHADEIAANVAGSSPLKESLLRMNLAEYSLNEVLNFYETKFQQNLKSENIYREQRFVMEFVASKNNLEFKNNLPIVSEMDISKYNKSKLTIKDQWASHPSTEDRIKALELLNITKNSIENHAVHLFNNYESTQKRFTEKIFSEITYTEQANTMEFEKFKAAYSDSFKKNSFDPIFNSYYDNKNPMEFDVESITDFEVNETIDTLYSIEKVDMVYDLIGFENDKEVLMSLVKMDFNVKFFDYDGQKYHSDDAILVIPRISSIEHSIKEKIKENDINIYKFFYSKALKKGHADILKAKYIRYFDQNSVFEDKATLYKNIINALGFLNISTPFEQISENLKEVFKLECELKAEIKIMIEDDLLKDEISTVMQDNFDKYLSKDWMYFDGESYYNSNLQILYSAIDDYSYILSRKYFLLKLDLLKYQLAQL